MLVSDTASFPGSPLHSKFSVLREGGGGGGGGAGNPGNEAIMHTSKRSVCATGNSFVGNIPR